MNALLQRTRIRALGILALAAVTLHARPNPPSSSMILMGVPPPSPSRSAMSDASGRPAGTADTSGSTTIQTRLRDASARSKGTVRSSVVGATTRFVVTDASGRVTGRATTRKAGHGTQTRFEDASGRLVGHARSTASATRSSTTFTDASGRTTGRATTTQSPSAITSRLHDASGRHAGTLRTFPPQGR